MKNWMFFFPLAIMLFSSFVNVTERITTTSTVAANATGQVNNAGATSSLSGYTFGLDPVVAIPLMIGIAIVFAITTIVAGLQGGLSRLMVVMGASLGLWLLLTLTGLALFLQIPFGGALYTVLGMFYVVGIINLSAGMSGSE